MRIDVVSIFPDYLSPLRLSLPGKAVADGLVELQVHDLRSWAHDRHRTVDDTPYGGGAGMVMTPGPWGEAFDELAIEDAVVVVPTPAGMPFTQEVARELAGRDRLVFACGRYEGIDQRVVDHARARTEVREISLGDFVLNGGEVAALAMIEAVVRLIHGFMGNPDSLAEESYEQGLLEYPVYTKPAQWRGLDAPAVLRSGDHGAIAEWRREQALRRTAERRPDLLPRSALAALGNDALVPHVATAADAAELWVLTRACWVSEAQLNDGVEIPALHEGLDDVVAGIAEWSTWVARTSEGRLVASVRARGEGGTWEIGRLMVAPDLIGRGIGRALLEFAEGLAPPEASAYSLVTGSRSARNLRMYRKAGYRSQGEVAPGVVRLSKSRRSSS